MLREEHRVFRRLYGIRDVRIRSKLDFEVDSSTLGPSGVASEIVEEMERDFSQSNYHRIVGRFQAC